MWEALANAFAASGWPYAFLAYVVVGAIVARPSGGPATRVMGVLGWPIELAQRLAGSGPLPYLFLLPNLLIFGIFTFAPLFINVGFSFTEGQSINFSERPFAGTDNWARLLAERQIDTEAENLEDDKFYRSVMGYGGVRRVPGADHGPRRPDHRAGPES